MNEQDIAEGDKNDEFTRILGVMFHLMSSNFGFHGDLKKEYLFKCNSYNIISSMTKINMSRLYCNNFS